MLNQNLSSGLEEEINMEQIEYFVVHGYETKVSMLVKYFYGLKQAFEQYHENFNNRIISIGFKVNEVISAFTTSLKMEFALSYVSM